MAVSRTETPIPSRFGRDLPRARRQAAPLKILIRGNPEPSEAQWTEIGQSLNHGDPTMDALVQWLAEEGGEEGRRLFERALAKGIASLESAPAPLRDFFARCEQPPAWLEPERLLRGAHACGISGMAGLYVLRDLGLMAGYQASAINKTLVLTGALEKGPQRRLAETTKWWIDATRPGGMDRGAPGWCSTLRVRLIHAHVRRAVQRHPEWDVNEMGLPVNQCDMHATWLAFSVIFLFGQRLLGVVLSSQERRDLMHLWRYIGWLMGVDERWLTDDEMQGRVDLYRNLLGQAPADRSSAILGRALMDEPLSRHYANLPWLRGRWNRAKHLSILRTFFSAESMRNLGLPADVLPWYPVLSFPPRLSWHLAHRVLPGGRERLIRRGLREQQEYLQVLFGGAQPELVRLESAAHPRRA